MDTNDQNRKVDREEFNKKAARRLDELRRQKGGIRGIVARIFRWFSPGIAAEAREDWLRVRRDLDIAIARRFEAGGVSLKGADQLEDADQLATASAYLELARYSDLAETWGLVNQADEVLCRLAPAGERETRFKRLQGLEPLLKHWLKELYGDEDVVNELAQRRQDSQQVPCESIFIHSQQWTLINQWISFSRKLWRLSVWVLLLALVLAIWVAEYITPPDPLLPLLPLPYAAVAGLGLFGGALSVLLSSRASTVTAITYGRHKSHIFMRLLLGAAGAYVMYVLVRLPGLVDEELSTMLRQPSGFVALGIVAGFSERLFQDALENLAGKFPTSAVKSSDKKSDGGE